MQKLLLLCFTVWLVSCNGKQVSYVEDKGEIFHTTYSIKYKYSHSLKSEIEAELAKFDNSLNPFKPTSIISKVNNNEAVVLDSFFVNVFNKAQEVSKVSDGLFDITVSPLINAWGFGFKNLENVTPEMIDSLKSIVGYDKIQFQDGQVIKTDPRIQINTSAIAKGYSTDVIANLLESYGIADYMIEIGGEVTARGVNAKGEYWHIGIDKPMDEKAPAHRELQAIIQLCDKSMATSGSYRNFYIKDSKKYAHTINPKTGYPSESNILSATVIADDCMTADAYATVFMLADTANIRSIAEKANLSYLLILDSGNDSLTLVNSSDFEKYRVR
ncbi:thiamine biosynthesis lipoprotein [Dysgonomonas alginatilytica]|uniref:FAD:protein FMN transferase n=1 Tax=Dysgonomonas alginatilytica TaxID=1605892 RepID=A0A2V3PNY0_9BACT|nr:FAD:protein FMN transferase [Dysgonomonas alginatilytica]PXV63814.1 thiamine biosynthesis lipoprotein [Dysgonomonas alginatilytica]